MLLQGPYPPPFGGIATLFVSLLSGFRDAGATDIAILDFCTRNSVEQVDGATVYRFNLKTQVWKVVLPQNWSTLIAVRQTLMGYNISFQQLVKETIKAILVDFVAKKHQSNVVNFHQSHASLEMLACQKKWGKFRATVLNIYGEIYDNFNDIEPRKELYHSIIKSPLAVIASSNHCARSFRKIGINRPIETIYVGVDMDRFADDGRLRRNYRKNLNVNNDVTLLLYMGRFESEMGLDSLIEIMPSLIKAKGNAVKIVFAGASGRLDGLALECQRIYPEHIVIMNNVAFDTQPSLYAAADIVLTPTRMQHACMGVTIKEAMAASRPVIGSDSGGIPEAIVNNITGLIVPLRKDGHIDTSAFEAAIISLVGQSERCLEMGIAARKRAFELFSENTTVRRTASVFMNSIPHV